MSGLIQAYLARAAELIGERTSGEAHYDDAVVEALNRGRSLREALRIAGQAYPDEAMAVDDSSYDDVSAHYEYLRQHTKILAALRAAEARPEAEARKLVGVFAYRSRSAVVCADGDACLVAGSEQEMQRYLAEMDPSTAALHTIKKTRFGEVLQGLCLGAAYAFDQEAYARFYPLAVAAGLPVSEGEFSSEAGRRFFTVRLLQP